MYIEIAGVIAAFAAIAAVDLPLLLRRKKPRALIVYAAVFLSAFALSELHVLRVELWSPNVWITAAVKWIFQV